MIRFISAGVNSLPPNSRLNLPGSPLTEKLGFPMRLSIDRLLACRDASAAGSPAAFLLALFLPASPQRRNWLSAPPP
uniref:Uncharacterized protein n=1 Tax=Arundo donax TaxID=35708 RepID=A0A0A9CKX0_ARUDO